MPFVMRTWMYASGVMFSIPIMLADKPQWIADVLQWNPAAIYMDLMRFALIDELRLREPARRTSGRPRAAGPCSSRVGGFVYFWKAEERYGRG